KALIDSRAKSACPSAGDTPRARPNCAASTASPFANSRYNVTAARCSSGEKGGKTAASLCQYWSTVGILVVVIVALSSFTSLYPLPGDRMHEDRTGMQGEFARRSGWRRRESR